jgi:hypothetical protein
MDSEIHLAIGIHSTCRRKTSTAGLNRNQIAAQQPAEAATAQKRGLEIGLF